MPTFEEANAKITNELVGRTIEYVYRDGLDLVIRTTCSHEVRLAATVDHHIVHKKTDVRIMLTGVDMFPEVGKF